MVLRRIFQHLKLRNDSYSIRPFSLKQLVMIIQSCLYLGYTIAFGIQLRSWNEDTLGQCYITSSIAVPSNRHPYVDHIYIPVTCLWVIGSLYGALGRSRTAFSSTKYGDRIQSALNRVLDRERQRREASGIDTELLTQMIPPIRFLRATTTPTFTEDLDGKQIAPLPIALMQYPVHMYSIFVMRATNESHLQYHIVKTIKLCKSITSTSTIVLELVYKLNTHPQLCQTSSAGRCIVPPIVVVIVRYFSLLSCDSSCTYFIA